MKLISNYTWKGVPPQQAADIKSWLLSNGATEDLRIKNPHEEWRVGYSDATVTYYKSGSLFITDSDDELVLGAHAHIAALMGSRFISPTKDCLIGLDETGKGEVLGHTVLVGVVLPRTCYAELERDIGVADTKVKHTVGYWDDVFRKIDYYQSRGLRFLIEKIPPWQFDRYNINKLLDVTYQRILLLLTHGVPAKEVRVVIDDYGAGLRLNQYLAVLQRAGAEVIKTAHADDSYLESRVASLIAKREQQKVLAAISANPEFQLFKMALGSGNAGDPQTVGWLKGWRTTGKPWPWFVKSSFKTVRHLEGFAGVASKQIPPLNEGMLSKEFREKFENGELNIQALSVVCPCGVVSKAIKLIPREGKTTPICVACQRSLPDAGLTLRYYCGRVLPDSSAIARGFLSADLARERFFEGFTLLLHPVTRQESDAHPGGKKELERLGQYSAIGRIRLQEIRSLFEAQKRDNLHRDEAILEDAVREKAIIITADNSMKGAAQAKGLFVMGLS